MFLAANEDKLELSGGISVSVGKDEIIVENDDNPVIEIGEALAQIL